MSERRGLLHPKLTEAVLARIARERVRQDEKWGEQDHDTYHWLTILMEEVGESARGAWDESGYQYVSEMVEVAAVAVAAIESYYRQVEARNVDAVTFLEEL